MRDREPKALRQKGEPADGRRRIDLAQLLRLDESSLPRRPGDGAVGPQRDMIDPATFRVGRECLAVASDIEATTLPSSPPETMRSPSVALERMAPP